MKASKSLIRDFGEIENLQVSSKGPGDFVSAADNTMQKCRNMNLRVNLRIKLIPTHFATDECG